MRNSQTAMWTVFTLLIAMLLAVVAYFLAIAPQLAATENAHSERQAAMDFNDQLDLKILAAKAKEKDVPTWLGQMNAIAIDLPSLPNQPELHRLIVRALEAQELPVVGISYGTSQLIAPPAADATAPAPAPTTDGTDTADEPSATPSPAPDENATPAPPAATDTGSLPAVEGLVGLPVTVITEGDPTAVLRFLADLQSQDERFLTVTNLDITRAEVADEVHGRRALTTSDWIVSVTYLSFSLIDKDESFPTEEEGSNPPYTGGVITNPFVPLDGSGL